MRSSALGVLPQCPRGLMLDCARHTSHCESNFGSFCRGCPTQRSRVPSSVSWVDSSRLRSCSVAASRLGFYLVSPPSSRQGSGPRLVASPRVGLAGGSWWLVVAGWCLTVSLGGSWGLAGVLRSPWGFRVDSPLSCDLLVLGRLAWQRVPSIAPRCSARGTSASTPLSRSRPAGA